jgi:hypothetical protein
MQTSKKVTEKDHAVIFARLARSVIDNLGMEDGILAVRKIVRIYGEQRGHRMALRATRDGWPLNMAAFLVYKEWVSLTGDGSSEMTVDDQNIHTKINRCPWNNAWLEADLLVYGKVYCQEIDQALVRGFNPRLQIDVNSTLSNDLVSCGFVYHQAVEPEKPLHPVLDPILPWEYHCTHLIVVFDEFIQANIPDTGINAVHEALEYFRSQFDKKIVDEIINYQSQSFICLPS